jgi:hypothetical protein
VRRRFLLTAAAIWPLAPSIARYSDQPRRVGTLFATGENDAEGQRRLSTLMASLERLGWVEGQNLQLIARWSDGDPERARMHAAEIISAQVDVVQVFYEKCCLGLGRSRSCGTQETRAWS